MPIFFCFFALLMALPVLWPRIDILMSALFYRPGQGFYLAGNSLFVALHWLAYDGARLLGIGLAMLAGLAFVWRRKLAGCDGKAWLFLFLALIIGPGLIANVGLKDHWGRFRPREVSEFGGAANFTPALEPHFENAHSNGSFVAGDPAFGFFLPAFAYASPRRLSRRIFWGTFAAGTVFGFVRLAMGAHFFGDVVYAAFMMLASTAGLHAAMYGKNQTASLWRSWFKRPTAV